MERRDILVRINFSLMLVVVLLTGCFPDHADPIKTESDAVSCQDGDDNDGDQKKDCLDEDCQGFAFCIEAGPAQCQDGQDNDLDGKIDCQDEDCLGYVFCVENNAVACQDKQDNDLDGKTDCDDADCSLELACRNPTKVKAWYKIGLSDETKGAGDFEVIPDMQVEFELDGEHVVLTDFDINLYGADGDWISTRLKVNQDVDANWTHVRPQGSTNEDDHMHLHRVDVLDRGTYQITAEWGEGLGAMRNVATKYNVWTRRLAVVAIPKEMGVKSWYKTGSNTTCRQGSNSDDFENIDGMDIAFDLDEDCEVLIQFDMNYVGASGNWLASRFVVDGEPEVKNYTHSQPYGGENESDHVHLFKMVSLPKGSHSVQTQWGYGAGNMCNLVGDDERWTRRLSVVAIPKSSGVKAFYVEGSTDECKVASPGVYTTIPQMELALPLMDTNEPVILLTHFNMNWGGAPAHWMAARLVLEGNGVSMDPNWTHSQPLGGPAEDPEDDIIHLVRLDYLMPGYYWMKAEWGEGGGTMCNNTGSYSHNTRRLGVLVLPAGDR